MIQNHMDDRQAELNEMVEAFEAAHAEHDDVDLSEYLPAADHALYLEARRELLRVDLELSWRDGRRHRIPYFVAQFPDLLQDRATVQDVAYEEFRLRLLAGEAPSVSEYEALYGVTTAGWTPGKVHAAEPSPATEIRADAELFLNIARTLGRDDSWRSTRRGDIAQALFQQIAPQSTSEAKFLLSQAMTALPEVGAAFLSFELIAELGHGSFGRVYLARQGDLANRLVALKITVDLLGEEQKLAQLQHTNVVPIYSVHQAGAFQAVCMPYFGPATLADVIRDIRAQANLPTAGKEIVRTLHKRKTAFLTQMPPSARAQTESGAGQDRLADLKMFEEASYIDAILSIIECVTQGLIHAHERGILHRDLKPANILLTDEGRPMLVDFNLSADTKHHTGLSELQVGGTLPYMAPENLEAMRGANRTTDVRSDLYGLGVVLFELLTGRLPFESHAGNLSEILPPMIAERLQAPPSLRRLNPAITPAVESIVRHCLHADPAKRYQSADDLHDDLKRQRHHRPLRYAPEPSLRERAQKWARRHPRLTSPSSLGGMAIFLVLCYMAPFTWIALQHLMERVRKADNDANAAKQKTDALATFREFEKTAAATARSIREIVAVMQMLPEARAYEESRLAQELADCRRSLQIYHVLEDADWQRQASVRELPPAEREQLRRKVAELLCALVHAEQASVARLLHQTDPRAFVVAASFSPGLGCEFLGAWTAMIQACIQSAAIWNDRACACYDDEKAPRYLLHQKAAIALLGGDSREAERLNGEAEMLPWSDELDERCWAASALIAKDRWSDAVPLLKDTTERFPDRADAWLLLAWCLHDDKDSGAAKACYDTYVTLQPEGAWGYYSRGLLSLRDRNWLSAANDFTKVIERHPSLALAYGHRASALHGDRKNLGAITDLTCAIEYAQNVPEYYFLRAQVHESLAHVEPKHRELAKRDRQRFLEWEPMSYSGRYYRGLLKKSTDPNGALADFEQALQLAPDRSRVFFETAPRDARADSQKALSLTPKKSRILYEKACLRAEDFGRPFAVVETIGAIEIFGVVEALGTVEAMSQAVQTLNQALEQDPEFCDARSKRGILLAKLGQRDQAVEEAERLIQLEPTPARYYEAASIYSLTSPKDPHDAIRAIRLLGFALRSDHGVRVYERDPHFSPIANLPEFRRLAEGLKLLGTGVPPSMRP